MKNNDDSVPLVNDTLLTLLLEAYWEGEMEVSQFAFRCLQLINPVKFQ